MKTQPRQHISSKYNTCTVVTSPVYIGENEYKILFILPEERGKKKKPIQRKYLLFKRIHTFDTF